MSRVILAMSGGVDSSVAAHLLQQQWYEVIGVTFKNFDFNELAPENTKRNCCSLELINDARQVCDLLDIPHFVINRVKSFKENVLDNFKESYINGITPNPCIRCNSLVRWPELIDLAIQMDTEFIATGHYAQVITVDGRPYIHKALSESKDQSYALWGIKQDYLKKTLLPIGKYQKEAIREIAAANGFRSADTPDSQDICFVPEGKYADLISQSKPGDIINSKGQVIGKHSGLPYYTIGQRKGLGIANPEPLYVLRIDPQNNRLVVGLDNELFEAKFEVSETNWFIPVSDGDIIYCQIKIRYRHQPTSGKVSIKSDKTATVEFIEPQRAITPGQSAAFYQNEILIGGGVISTVN
jgi:tRNA-specific 2-thiouridylase